MFSGKVQFDLLVLVVCTFLKTGSLDDCRFYNNIPNSTRVFLSCEADFKPGKNSVIISSF